jgi:hypothetical protein
MPLRHVPRGAGGENIAPLHSVSAYVFRLFNPQAGSHTCSSAPRTYHSFFQDVLFSCHLSDSRSALSSFTNSFCLIYNLSPPLFSHSLHMVKPSELVHRHPLHKTPLDSTHFSDSFIPHSICQPYICNSFKGSHFYRIN